MIAYCSWIWSIPGTTLLTSNVIMFITVTIQNWLIKYKLTRNTKVGQIHNLTYNIPVEEQIPAKLPHARLTRTGDMSGLQIHKHIWLRLESSKQQSDMSSSLLIEIQVVRCMLCTCITTKLSKELATQVDSESWHIVWKTINIDEPN